MKSLEYYAKRGLLGLDAHDAAHSGDVETLQKMFPQFGPPGGQLVAQNTPSVNEFGFEDKLKVNVPRANIPSMNLGGEAPTEGTTRSKRIRSQEEADLNYRLMTAPDNELTAEEIQLRKQLTGK